MAIFDTMQFIPFDVRPRVVHGFARRRLRRVGLPVERETCRGIQPTQKLKATLANPGYPIIRRFLIRYIAL